MSNAKQRSNLLAHPNFKNVRKAMTLLLNGKERENHRVLQHKEVLRFMRDVIDTPEVSTRPPKHLYHTHSPNPPIVILKHGFLYTELLHARIPHFCLHHSHYPVRKTRRVARLSYMPHARGLLPRVYRVPPPGDITTCRLLSFITPMASVDAMEQKS